MPYNVELPDGTLVEVPDDIKPTEAKKLIIGKYAGSHGIPRAAGQEGSNKLAALLSGAASVTSIVPGIAGLVTGNYKNAPLAGAVESMREKAQSMESPELAYKKAIMDRAIARAGKDGVGSEAFETLKQLVQNPQVTGLKMLELVPDILASIGTGGVGAVAGRGIAKLGARQATKEAAEQAAKEAAEKYGTRTAIGQAALSEGSGTGLDTFEEVYRLEKAKGASDEEAARTAASRARMAQLASTGVSALTAAALPGIEKAAFRAKPAGILRTGAGESGQEMIEGGTSQFAQNVAANASDPTIGLTRNLGRTVTEGGVLGALAGGVGAVPSSFRRPETAPAEPPAPPAAETEAAPETPPGTPSGTSPAGEIKTPRKKNTVASRKADYENRLEDLSLDASADENTKIKIAELTKQLEEASNHPALTAISREIKTLQTARDQRAANEAARKKATETAVEGAVNDADASATVNEIKKTANDVKTAVEGAGQGAEDAVSGGTSTSVSVAGSATGSTGTGEANVPSPRNVVSGAPSSPKTEAGTGAGTDTLGDQAAAKKKADEEAAAAAKKKADEEAAAAAKKKADEEAAAAAKKKADEEAAAAAKKKADEEAAAAAAAQQKADEEADKTSSAVIGSIVKPTDATAILKKEEKATRVVSGKTVTGKKAKAKKEEIEEEEAEPKVKQLTDEELKTYKLPQTTPTAQSQKVSKELKKLRARIGANLDLTPRVDLDYGRATAKINDLLTKPGGKRTSEEKDMHAYVKGVQSLNPQSTIEDVFKYLAHDLADATENNQKISAQAARTYVEKALGKDALKKLDATVATVKNNLKEAKKSAAKATKSAGLSNRQGTEYATRTGAKSLKNRLAQIIAGNREKLTARERATEERYADEDQKQDRELKQVIAERLYEFVSASKDLKFEVVDELPTPGQFDPATNTITIRADSYSDDLLIHETTHAFVDHAIDNPEKLNEEQKIALSRLKNIFELIPEDRKQEYRAETLKEFVAQAFSNSEFQAYLKKVKVPIRPFSFFKAFTEAVARLLKISPAGNAFTEALDAVDRIISVPTKTMRGKEVSYAPGDRVAITSPSGETIYIGSVPAEPTVETTEEGIKKRKAREQREANLVKLNKQSLLGRVFPSLFGRRSNYDYLVRKFENERRPIQTIQEGIVARGALVVNGPNTNAVSLHLDQASSRSSALFNERVSPVVKKLDAAIAKFADITKTKVDEAMDRLNKYFIALHEPERRQAIFYRKVREYLDSNGQSEHQRIFEKLYDEMDNPLPTADVRALRADLDKLIQNDPKLAQTLQDAGLTMEQFRNSSAFDVVGIKVDVIGPNGKPTGEQQEIPMTSAMQKQFADSFANIPPEVKAVLEEIRTYNRELNKVILDLDKKGRYAGPQVQNIINFYDFQDYVPFRGLEKDPDADVIDPRSKRLGGELAQSEQSMEGRVTEPENVLARNRVQAVRASQRPARYDLTLSIKNATEAGFIAGPAKAKKITFKERIRDEGRDKLPKAGENVVYHYDDGGNVYVVKLDDPIVSRAFRQVYVDVNPLVKFLNVPTRFIAKGFTFYNPQFWLTNFIGDIFTSATIFAAEDAKGMQFLRTVASDMVRNKLISKTITFTRLYNQGTEQSWAKLRELAKKDEYIARALEFVGSEAGGKTAYVSGFSTDTQMQQLVDNLSPSRYRKATNSINGFFAVASDAFELASRLATYKTYRDMGMSVAEAANKTKNHANFEHVGEWGRGLGSWFMFFRQSATGAVRAIDALAKGKYGPQTALTMAGIGFSAYMFAALISGDDEEGRNRVFNDDADRWTRNARFFLPGFEDAFQMRWGFGINGFAAAGAQMAALIFGRSTLSQFAENTFKDILTENLIPLPLSKMNVFADPVTWLLDTVVPAPVKPLVQISANRDALDRAIVSSTRGGQRFQDPYAFNQNVPAWIRDFTAAFAEATDGKVEVSPNYVNFVLANYLGAIHKYTDAADNLIRTITGDQDFDFVKATMIFKGFSGPPANVDIADYYRMRDTMESYERTHKSLQRRGGDALDRYEDKYPERIEAYKAFNEANAQIINPLNKERNDVRYDRELSSKDKKEQIKDITNEQKVLMRGIMDDVNDILGVD